MTGARPIRKEACTLIKSFANPKKMLRIGNWNVRTMYSVGKTAQVVREMQRLTWISWALANAVGLVLDDSRHRQVKLFCIREEMTTYTKVVLHW